MNRRITFSVLPEQHEEAERYAIVKGFGNLSNMARYSLFRFMNQYPVEGRKHAKKLGDDSQHGKGQEDSAEALPERLAPGVGEADVESVAGQAKE